MKARFPLRTVVVDSTPERAEVLVGLLRESGYVVEAHYVNDARSLELGLAAGCDVILIAGAVDDLDVAAVMRGAARVGADAPVLAVTRGDERADGQLSREALRSGARDVVSVSDTEHFLHVLRRELAALADRRDIGRLKQALSECDAQCRAFMKSSHEAVAYVRGRTFVEANQAYLDLFGYASFDALKADQMDELVAAEDREEFRTILDGAYAHLHGAERIELSMSRADRSSAVMCLDLRPATLDGLWCVQVTAWRPGQRERPAAAEEPGSAVEPAPQGRDAALQALARAICIAASSGIASTLVYLEVQEFMALRTSIGLLDTEGVLEEVGRLLVEKAGGEATVSRWQDDGFVIVLGGGDNVHAETLSETLLRSIAAHPFAVSGRTVTVSCRVGIAAVTAESRSGLEVLEQAYAAARSAREYSRPIRVYAQEQGGFRQRTDGIAGKIVDAVGNSRLQLVYQPIVSMRGERAELYEVFLRMEDANGAEIAPAVFFPAAREHGLIGRLDSWIIDRTVRVLAEQHAHGHRVDFFVKLSSEAMKDVNTPVGIARCLKEHPAVASHLIVEVSESAASRDIDNALAFMDSLHRLGCRTALEHFGGGLISSRLIELFPVEFLKIDSAMIGNMIADERSARAVRELVREAKAASKATIAECLEDAQSLVALYQADVDYVQGYYFQEPRPSLDYDFKYVTA